MTKINVTYVVTVDATCSTIDDMDIDVASDVAAIVDRDNDVANDVVLTWLMTWH